MLNSTLSVSQQICCRLATKFYTHASTYTYVNAQKSGTSNFVFKSNDIESNLVSLAKCKYYRFSVKCKHNPLQTIETVCVEKKERQGISRTSWTLGEFLY